MVCRGSCCADVRALGIGSAAQASGDSVKMLDAREIALPEGKEVFEGVTMTDKSDGTYSYKVGDMAVENRDLALKDTLVSLSDEGEIEPFPFVTIDENNLDATGPEGKTARFARHAEGEKAA